MSRTRNRNRHDDFLVPSSRNRSSLRKEMDSNFRSRSRTREKQERKAREMSISQPFKTGFSPFKHSCSGHFNCFCKKNESPSAFLEFNHSHCVKSKERSVLVLSFERILQSSSSKKYNVGGQSGLPKMGNIREFELKEEDESSFNDFFSSPIASRIKSMKKISSQSTNAKKKTKETSNFLDEGSLIKRKKKKVKKQKKVRFLGEKDSESKQKLEPLPREKKTKTGHINQTSKIVFGSDGGFFSDSEFQSNKSQPFSLGDLSIQQVNNISISFGESERMKGSSNPGNSSSKDFLVNLSSILKYSENEQIKLAKRQKAKYVCKYCGQVFTSGCALGGHVSKIHRGISLSYKKKQLNRKEKKIERDRTKFLKKMLQGK